MPSPRLRMPYVACGVHLGFTVLLSVLRLVGTTRRRVRFGFASRPWANDG